MAFELDKLESNPLEALGLEGVQILKELETTILDKIIDFFSLFLTTFETLSLSCLEQNQAPINIGIRGRG